MNRHPPTAALAGVLVVLGSLGGCGDPDGQDGGEAVDVLAADCLATSTVGGAAATTVQREEGGTALGKPVAARVTVQFPLEAGAEAAALAEAGRHAVGCGWTGFVTDPAPGGAVLYEKQLGDARAQAALSAQDAAGERVLVVSLSLPGG